jgi:hypothetical protein
VDEERVRRILEAKADALVRRDADALRALLDPRFAYINASGREHDRDSYIEAYCRSGRIVFASQTIADLQVTGFGAFAVARVRLQDVFRMADRVVEQNVLSLCVFSLDGSGCLWAAGQTMAVS